jgi:hypothetical protein
MYRGDRDVSVMYKDKVKMHNAMQWRKFTFSGGGGGKAS